MIRSMPCSSRPYRGSRVRHEGRVMMKVSTPEHVLIGGLGLVMALFVIAAVLALIG